MCGCGCTTCIYNHTVYSRMHTVLACPGEIKNRDLDLKTEPETDLLEEHQETAARTRDTAQAKGAPTLDMAAAGGAGAGSRPEWMERVDKAIHRGDTKLNLRGNSIGDEGRANTAGSPNST